MICFDNTTLQTDQRGIAAAKRQLFEEVALSHATTKNVSFGAVDITKLPMSCKERSYRTVDGPAIVGKLYRNNGTKAIVYTIIH